MSAVAKLRYELLFCSSEDDFARASELTRPLPSTRGWQSAKQCEYPQQLAFRFDGEVTLRQVQILVHESKTPARIDVYVSFLSPSDEGQFPTYESSVFLFIGYVSFSRNADGRYKSGELRSVRLDDSVRILYLKLVIREPHENPLNFYGQVGITSVVCVGTVVTRLAPSLLFPRQRSTQSGVMTLATAGAAPDPAWVSGADGPGISGAASAALLGRSAAGSKTGALTPLQQLMLDVDYDRVILGKIKELTAAKEHAAIHEQYDLARRLKLQIDELIPVGAKLQSLESRKRQATLDEDFEMAHLLKLQIEELRAQAISIRVAQSSPSHRLELSMKSQHAAAAPAGGFTPSLPASPGGRMGASSPFVLPAYASAMDAGAAASPSTFGESNRHGATGYFGEEATGYHSAGGGGSGPSDVPFDERPAVASGHAAAPPDVDSAGAPARGSALPDEHTGDLIGPKDMMHYDVVMQQLVSKRADDPTPPENVRSSCSDVPNFSDIVATLGLYTTCCAFSKRHALREAVIQVLREHGDRVLTHCDSTQLVSAYVMLIGARGIGVHDAISGVVCAAMEMASDIAAGAFHGNCTVAMQRFGLPLARPVVAKAGDAQLKIRTLARRLLRQWMLGGTKQNAVGVEGVLKWATDASVGGTGFRAWCGRIDVIEEALIDVLKWNPKTGRLDEATAFAGGANPSAELRHLASQVALPALEHAHKEVRERGVSLLCLLHRRFGEPAIASYVAQMKPSLKKIFDERLASFQEREARRGDVEEAADAAGHRKSGEPKTSGGPTIRRKLQHAKKQSQDATIDGDEESHGVAPQAPVASDSRPDESNTAVPPRPKREAQPAAAAPPSSSSKPPDMFQKPPTPKERLPAKPRRRLQPQAEGGTCQFCGLSDTSFFHHPDLVQHFKAECPMLCTCPLCELPVEIRDVHWHLADDCEFRTRLKQCPRCFEAVRVEEYDAHVEAKKCNLYSEEYTVCPLCHTRLPSGDAFWEVHVMTPPYCRGNPRTASDALE